MLFLRISALILFLNLTLWSQQSSAQSETIVAYSNVDDLTTIKGYTQTGAGVFELKLTKDNVKSIVSGYWSSSSSVLVLVGEARSARARVLANNGSMISEINLPDEPINTVFSSDLNSNGYSDLVLMVHANNKAKAVIYYDPGISSSAAVSFQMPTASLYYAPAIAGTSAIGILAYNPQSPKASGAKKRKAKKSKDKKAKAVGTVQIVSTQGSLIKSYSMKKPVDGQIYPFSPDGQCGFAIQNGAKLRTYLSSGAVYKDVTLSSENTAAIGNFSGSANLEEILVPDTVGLNLTNISTGAITHIALSGLPNQKDSIEQEIGRISNELIEGSRTDMPVARIIELRDQLGELLMEKEQIITAANVAGRLVRLFTGGVGAIEGVCDSVDETPNDGYGGFLVKNGDFSGKIVILTPGGKEYFNAELVKFGSYKVMQKLQDSGYGNPDSNGARKHFRGNGTIQSIGKFIFRASIKESYFSDKIKRACWFINKPASRID